METTLHRQLKAQFCLPGCEQEVKLGRYRIDVVDGQRLIEIQHSSLAAIRTKVEHLLKSHAVDVVKPIVLRKKLIKLSCRDGNVVSVRMSPKRGGFLELIDELMYFRSIFPHPKLRIIAPMIEVEEIRFPGHGRRRRKRTGDFVVQDRRLTEMTDIRTFAKSTDLLRELPTLKQPFGTAELAQAMGIGRDQAQRVTYVLTETGSLKRVGKIGNAILYRKATARAPAVRAEELRKRKKGAAS